MSGNMAKAVKMQTTPKTLTVTECHQLLDALLCKEGTPLQFRKGIRNYTMALLMLDAGLRVGEVVQLHQDDLMFSGAPVENLVVREEIAKTKTERTIPLSSRVHKAIQEMQGKWWADLHPQPGRHAFYQRDGCGSLTTRQVERIIRTAAEKSIGRPVHPHMLRHTFGTRIERKAGIRIAQVLLGHENVTSTQIYTHPNQDDMKKAVSDICEDEQERHLFTTDSSLDRRAPDSVDAR